MLPYTVIKEANPPEMSGTATGVVNFLNFTFSALLGPVFGWILMTRQRRRRDDGARALPDGVRAAAYGVGLAIVLTLLPEGNRTRGRSRATRAAVARTT